jgi:hypothetical protein
MAERRSGEIEPVYLMLEDILELYGLIIGSTATVAADHLRNRDGLESAPGSRPGSRLRKVKPAEHDDLVLKALAEAGRAQAAESA